MPYDPSSVVYVWFDALINYVAAVGLGTDEALFAKWWPADLHVIGKDITRFHAVIWPAMLMSAGLPLPRQVFGHGWVHFKGEKMSKSLGTIVDPLEARRAVRRRSAAAVSDQGDRLRQRRRLLVGAVRGALQRRSRQQPRQPRQPDRGDGGEVSRRPRSRRPAAPGRLAAVAAAGASTTTATRWTRSRSSAAPRRRSASSTRPTSSSPSTEPWALARDAARARRLTQVLFDVAEAVRVAAVLLLPVMPKSAAEILRRVGETRPAGRLRLDDAAWRNERRRARCARAMRCGRALEADGARRPR